MKAKIKTSELTGAALDWAVAKCEGDDYRAVTEYNGIGHEFPPTNYSTDWAQGGPIIERNRITWSGQSARICKYFGGHTWQNFEEFGTTPLIAAMRCYVASKLGDEVEVPKDLAA